MHALEVQVLDGDLGVELTSSPNQPEVRSGLLLLCRPKSRTMRATRQLMLPQFRLALSKTDAGCGLKTAERVRMSLDRAGGPGSSPWNLENGIRGNEREEGAAPL